ncbi:MAG: hypothetical protein JJT75_03300, partial [Opitutales bacterium]|nr:hypothetical protein [Opitutales bacterium]
AKEEITKLLTQRERDRSKKRKGWRLFCAFSDGIALGTRGFVRKWVNGIQKGERLEPPELYQDLFSGQKKARRSKG